MANQSNFSRVQAQEVALDPVISTYTTVQDALAAVSARGLIAPAASSHTASVPFLAFAVDTPIRNTLAYDVCISGLIKITSATAGTLGLGVGSSATPTTDPLLTSFTSASASIVAFSAVVPAGYYLSIVSGGTIVVASATAVATPL